MGLSVTQAKVLPQFKKMLSNNTPSQKDLVNFLKMYYFFIWKASVLGHKCWYKHILHTK